MAVTEAEISPGLVLHLDPDELIAAGATYTCAEAERVRGGHFFVCLKTNGQLSRWLPVYTDDGPGRVEILATDRRGHAKWTGGTCYYHPSQVWDAANAAIPGAAAEGRDQSRRGSRNQILRAAVAKL